MRPAGWREDGHNGYVWTFSTPTQRYFLRRGRGKAVVDEVLGNQFAGVLVSASTPPTTITTAPNNAAGPTCCGTSTTCAHSTPRTTGWRNGLTPSTNSTARPKPTPIPRPSNGASPNGAGTATAGHLPALPSRHLGNTGQAVPTHRVPHQEPAPYWIRGTLRLRSRTGGPTGQQRRRTQPTTSGRQPEGQRRHPVGTGQRQQDDPGLLIRHLAGPRTEPPHHLPTTALFPSTLNCYQSPANVTGAHRLRRQPTKPDENAGLR